jgi:hypothetical protein
MSKENRDSYGLDFEFLPVKEMNVSAKLLESLASIELSARKIPLEVGCEFREISAELEGLRNHSCVNRGSGYFIYNSQRVLNSY